MNISPTMTMPVPEESGYSDILGTHRVNGVTAQGVNDAAAHVMPKTMSSFINQGGIGNTINRAQLELQEQKKIRAQRAAFEKILAMQEAGADYMKNNLIKEHGQKIESYIAPKEVFYDQKTGAFMPYKYAESLWESVKNFKSDQAAEQTKLEAQQKEQMTMTGRSQLQELGKGFSGSSQDFAQMARQQPSYTTGAIDDKTIDAYSKSFEKPASKSQEIQERRLKLMEAGLRLRNMQFTSDEKEKGKDNIKFTIKEWQNEKEEANKKYRTLEASLKKKDAWGKPEVQDPVEVANTEEQINQLKQYSKDLDDNIKMGFVKLQDPNVKSVFGNDTNVPTSVINSGTPRPSPTPIQQQAPAPTPTPPSVRPSTDYRAKAIQVLSGSGRTSPSEAEINFIIEKIKAKELQLKK